MWSMVHRLWNNKLFPKHSISREILEKEYETSMPRVHVFRKIIIFVVKPSKFQKIVSFKNSATLAIPDFKQTSVGF